MADVHLSLRVVTVPRASGRTADGAIVDDPDDAEGEHLAAVVRGAVASGHAAPVAVVVREARIELVELGPALRARVPVPMFVAGLTRSQPEGQSQPIAIGLAGRFSFRPASELGSAPRRPPAPHPPPAQVALAFLEWSDNRWWHWRATVDGPTSLAPDSEVVRRAIDGDALPNGLGRWWSLARRTGATVRFGPPAPRTEQGPPLVH